MRKNNKKGFTLAELLIVVAIIAVLTAIAIPVFTSQLEKSREAVDLSNVRAAYAEVMAAALTTDGTAKYTADTTQTIKQSDGTYKVVVQLKQQQDGWQTDPANLEVGGVKASDSTHWTGSPTKATHTCTITYTPAAADGSGESTVFAWA